MKAANRNGTAVIRYRSLWACPKPHTDHLGLLGCFFFVCFFGLSRNLNDEMVSSHRGLSVKKLREEPPAGSAHLPWDMTVDLCDLVAPVVHYAVSTSPSNLIGHSSRLPPRPFPAVSTSNAKLLTWEIPNDGQAATRRPYSGPGGSQGSGLGRDPATCLDQSMKVEEAEVENSPHMVNPRSPLKSDCQPNSPAESSGCGRDTTSPPKVHNWKKYKFIVLNSAEGDENPLRNSNRCVPEPLAIMS